MNEDEFKVYLIPLPPDVRGAIRIDADGFASIYINDALSYFEQKEVFRHEIRHLRRGDMFSIRSIRSVEAKPRRSRCRARKNNT